MKVIVDSESQAVTPLMRKVNDIYLIMAYTIDSVRAKVPTEGKYMTSCFSSVAAYLRQNWNNASPNMQIVVLNASRLGPESKVFGLHCILYDPTSHQVIVDSLRKAGGEYDPNIGYHIQQGRINSYSIVSTLTVGHFKQQYFH